MTYYADFTGPFHEWTIRAQDGTAVDVVRTAAAAAYEVDLLNSGRAHVDRHAGLGRRVVLGVGA